MVRYVAPVHGDSYVLVRNGVDENSERITASVDCSPGHRSVLLVRHRPDVVRSSPNELTQLGLARTSGWRLLRVILDRPDPPPTVDYPTHDLPFGKSPVGWSVADAPGPLPKVSAGPWLGFSRHGPRGAKALKSADRSVEAGGGRPVSTQRSAHIAETW